MRNTSAFMLTLIVLVLFAGCRSEPSDMPPADAMPVQENTIDVTAEGLKFVAPDSIQSGWTTFRFENTADVVHFAVIERLPEGIGLEDHQTQVAPVFQEGMNFLSAGKPDSAFAAFGRLPSWFGEVVWMGGPGLTSPGHTSQTTVYLEEGKYLLECYAKTDGNFHSYNANPGHYGMVHEFTVTPDMSGAPVPEADLEITLSNDRGIEADSVITPGRHTIAVHFESQRQHENFVLNDVHLARLAEGTNVGDLAAWIDWSQPTGLQAPLPAEFLGGIEEMPEGSTGYFTATFEPGEYVWISEVTDPASKGMLKTFTVAPSSEGGMN